jgi:molybdate/tungstate transport system substrate-binding protein
MRRLFLWVLLSCVLTGCSGAPPRPAPKPTVRVAYAGSLQFVNEELLGPAFTRASGFGYEGQGGGSFGVAREIQAGILAADVFESLTAAPWRIVAAKSPYAIAFAASPLCIAYNPRSPFAPALRAIARGQRPLADLWPLLANARFHLGRTNPATDPQGRAFILAVAQGVRQAHLPMSLAERILGSADNPAQIFAEEAILSRLEGGQLDAASAFVPEAIQRHLPYIPLSASLNFATAPDPSAYRHVVVHLFGTTFQGQPLYVYIAPLGRSPGQEAFIAYTLSRAGLAIFRRAGFTLIHPLVLGSRARIPRRILSEL